MNKKTIYQNLPSPVKTLLIQSQGWLVGSAPYKLMSGEQPKDYDIVVPNRELFQTTLMTLPDVDLKLNTFGGMKIVSDITIDIWCEELDHFLSYASPFAYAYNLKRQILISNHE
jgi:hypothetical protein